MATEFFIAHGEGGAGWASQTKVLQASCADSSLSHISPKSPPPKKKKSHSISEELGDAAGGAYWNEMFAGKERNVVRGRNWQG